MKEVYRIKSVLKEEWSGHYFFELKFKGDGLENSSERPFGN